MTDPQQQAMPPLPCPFCGSNPTEQYIEPHVHVLVPMPPSNGEYLIECTCGAGMIAGTRDQVLSMWNRRALAASSQACQSKQPQDSRPDQSCADLTCGFVGGCSRKGGEARGCVVPEWRPIETAPKDGSEILMVSEEGVRVIGRWGKHNHVPLYGWIHQVELYGEEIDGFDPTHWMPLPASPSVTEAGGTIKKDLKVQAVAWRWWPSDYWREYVITQDPKRAEEAKTFGLKVEALGVIKEAQE